MIDNNLSGVPEQFRQLCDSWGVVYEADVRRDLLAATLATQLLLFAGPSGTGKSTAAKLLAEYFSSPDRTTTFDVRPLWLGPESLVGYWSSLSDSYRSTPSLGQLLMSAESVSKRTPFVVLEEANLTSIEIYGGEILTALSGTGSGTVAWNLHSETKHVVSQGMTVPHSLALGEWPRFCATINVDSTAGAPSPKVCGRGLTVLLDPPSLDLALKSVGALGNASKMRVEAPEGLLGDPAAAWYALAAGGMTDWVMAPLRTLCDHLETGIGANYVSPRDVQRSVLFMSWYLAIYEHETDDYPGEEAAATEAAELALLHAVLPGLSAGHFEKALKALMTHAQPGGALMRRVDRVNAMTSGIYGAQPDFWSALS